MKQLILFFCLVALVPLGISAQEDHDIVASLNLKEVVILADGQTFEEYLIKQVLDHAQPLKKRVRTLSYSVTCKMEKDMDLRWLLADQDDGLYRGSKQGSPGIQRNKTRLVPPLP